MSDGVFPDRLTQLRNRWEADPSSRIFLQLAEEYRHQGRVKEALDVLDRGLKEHPGYLSALVAKGRCHLELGEPELARTVLERVVKQDATQMVANKLLVRAYLDTSEPERARDRLDLYSLLNDSDPEIDELRRRLRAMEQPPQAEKPGSFPTPAVPLVEVAPALPPRQPRLPPPAPAPEGDIFDLGGPPVGRRGDVFDLTLPVSRAAAPVQVDEPFAELLAPAAAAAVQAPFAPTIAPAPVAAVAEPAPEPEEEPETEDTLFPGLATRESRRRYLDNFSAEGLFLLDLTGAALTPPSSLAEPMVAAPTVFAPEPPPVAVPTPGREEAPADLLESLAIHHGVSSAAAFEELPVAAWAAEEPAVEEEAIEEPRGGDSWVPATIAAAGISWEPVDEPALPPPQPVWSEPEEPAASAVAFDEEPTPWAVEPALPPVEVPAPEFPAGPAHAEQVATATLGELYLRQGHLGEAERIFREVLRREPESAAAYEGLARLAARRQERRPLEARELLAGYEPGPEGGEVEVKARKAWILNTYLKRLRQGSQRGVS